MSVSVRREVSNQGYTVIVFDKDHQYRWPTNMYEHNESCFIQAGWSL